MKQRTKDQIPSKVVKLLRVGGNLQTLHYHTYEDFLSTSQLIC